MKHLDLFSGIGGFAIAVDEVWPGSEHIFCDNDKFCQAVLKKHWPQSKIYGDIRALHADGFDTNADRNGCADRKAEINPAEADEQTLDNFEKHYGKIDIASDSANGGCREAESNENKKGLQARHEQTGKLARRFERSHSASADTIYKRPIQSEYEKWPRLEKGILARYKFTNGKIDILTGGFPCQPFSQAGKRKGTDDDRYLWPEMLRVIREFKPKWVIAENVRGLLTLQQGVVFEQVCADLEASGYEVQPIIIPAVAVNAPHRRDRVWFIAHRQDERGGGCAGQECGIQERKLVKSQSKGRAVRIEDKGRAGQRFNTREWERSWIEAATELCSVDDGLPVELDGLKLTKAGHRNAQLKAYGNAIVPQVAIEIMKAIKNNCG